MALADQKRLQQANPAPVTTQPINSKPTFTITPTGNFVFAQETNKSTIIATGHKNPSMADKMLKAAGSAFKSVPPTDGNLHRVSGKYLNFYQTYRPTGPDEVAMRDSLMKGYEHYLRAQCKAIRIRPFANPATVAFGLFTVVAGGAATTM